MIMQVRQFHLCAYESATFYLPYKEHFFSKVPEIGHFAWASAVVGLKIQLCKFSFQPYC